MSDTLDLAAIEARRRDALEWWSLMLSRDIVEKDVPALLARVRELEAALDEMTEQRNHYMNQMGRWLDKPPERIGR